MKLVAATLVATLLVWAAGVGAQPRERTLYVSALDRDGAPVTALAPDDVVVREDGARREVLRITPAREPMQIAVLVDNSQAARSNIPDLRRSLEEFVRTMSTAADLDGRNQLAIITLGERPTIAANYTMDTKRLIDAVDRIYSPQSSGAYLMQGIVEVCRGFRARHAERPVIVAVMAEGPEFSTEVHRQVIDSLKDAGAAFHALVVGQMSADMTSEGRERDIVLERGTRDTGGRRDQILTSMALHPKLREVASELLHQFQVTYARPDSLIPPERVTVAASGPGLTVRGTLVNDQQGSGRP